MPDSPSGAKNFWIEAFTWRGAVSRRVLPTTLAFSAFATIVYLLHYYLSNHHHEEINLAVEVGPHEVAGASTNTTSNSIVFSPPSATTPC